MGFGLIYLHVKTLYDYQTYHKAEEEAPLTVNINHMNILQTREYIHGATKMWTPLKFKQSIASKDAYELVLSLHHTYR